MITLAILCFAIGLGLIIAEMLLPGGILGLIGAGFLLLGSLFIGLASGVGIGLGSAIASFVLIGACTWIEARFIRNTRMGKALTLQGGVEGAAVDALPAALIGKRGVALAALVPGGPVRIDGRTYEARSVSGMIDRGREVVVERVADLVLVVRRHEG